MWELFQFGGMIIFENPRANKGREKTFYLRLENADNKWTHTHTHTHTLSLSLSLSLSIYLVECLAPIEYPHTHTPSLPLSLSSEEVCFPNWVQTQTKMKKRTNKETMVECTRMFECVVGRTWGGGGRSRFDIHVDGRDKDKKKNSTHSTSHYESVFIDGPPPYPSLSLIYFG